MQSKVLEKVEEAMHGLLSASHQNSIVGIFNVNQMQLRRMRPGRKTEERKEEFPQIVGQSRQNDYKEIWAQGAALANSTVNRIFCLRNLAILYIENCRIIQSHDGGGQGGGRAKPN